MPRYVRKLAGRRDLLAPAAAFPARYPGLLESAQRGTAQARYDILFALPQGGIEQDATGQLQAFDGSGARAIRPGAFLDELDACWSGSRVACAADDDELAALPFRSGWLLFLSYELAGAIEPRLSLPGSANLPRALAIRCAGAMIVDHLADCTWLVADTNGLAGARPDLSAMQLAESALDQMARDLAVSLPAVASVSPLQVEEDDAQRYLDGVERIHDCLRAGDVFQANLSRAWRAHYAVPPVPAALYLALRQANPAPFAGLLQADGWAIVSSSPERLVEVRGGIAQTRPIAGTRPRLAGDNEVERIRELTAHPKERAEHVMLIDLERNDLGRVCVPGTIEVNELMTVESYAHVHHIVSNVRGRLRAEVTPGQVIAATFPGGTITGCPKLRCMQILAELEDAPRGAYTGALGYLDHDGSMDLNILIRTLTQVGTEVSWRAGAGIVIDSQAEAELVETRAKARGLLRALGVVDP